MRTLVIIVNFHSVDLIQAAISSVQTAESVGRVETVVVDNSESPAEADTLRRTLPPGVRLLISPRNLGFGEACNSAYRRFPGEFVFLLNPDARLLPGGLLRLQKTLMGEDRIGAVGPQIYWDDGCSFLLPPSYPTALYFLDELLAQGPSASIYNRLARRYYRRRALQVWQGRTPIRVDGLSGGHCLLRRSAVEKSGGLFDPRFFLYFEDADLFMRLRKTGFSIQIDPRAGVVHYYDQCEQGNSPRKRQLMNASREAFFDKYGRRWLPPLRVLSRSLASLTKGDPSIDIDAPAPLSAPFRLKVPPVLRKRWLFEWSPSPRLFPSAGRLGCGAAVTFGPELWRLMAPGRYFGCLSDPGERSPRRATISWIVE